MWWLWIAPPRGWLAFSKNLWNHHNMIWIWPSKFGKACPNNITIAIKYTYPQCARCIKVDQCEQHQTSFGMTGILLEPLESPSYTTNEMKLHHLITNGWWQRCGPHSLSHQSPPSTGRGLKWNPLRSTDRRHAQERNPIVMVTNLVRSSYRSFIRSEYHFSFYHLLSITRFCYQNQLASLPVSFPAIQKEVSREYQGIVSSVQPKHIYCFSTAFSHTAKIHRI